MIINAEYKLVLTVEIDRSDIHKLLDGEDIYVSSFGQSDEPVLAQIYCNNPMEKTNAD